MSKVFIFPGQGSQFVGMGEELFPLFPDLVEQADDILGYSIVELCTKDPKKVLNQTQYTQPALFFVSVLSYLDWKNNNEDLPAYLAGHSLGEYCALYAAGAFDLRTGLKIVQKRGQLMANAPKGAMAAVLQLEAAYVSQLLEYSDFSTIDVANINSGKQVIISGLFDDVHGASDLFIDNGGRFIPLKVSAAFHSRYMNEVAEEFSHFLKDFSFNELKIPVLSNFTAKNYPTKNYTELLIKQIDHSVLWYESISWLLSLGFNTFEEIGPGVVLTKMVQTIIKEPLLMDNSETVVQQGNLKVTKSKPIAQRKNILMFAGQGSQYFGMAQALYREDKHFKVALDECDLIFKKLRGYSIIDEIYQSLDSDTFDYIGATHPAIFCLGYAMYRTMLAYELRVDGVLGHSLGEYIAAVASGVLEFEECLNLVMKQAELLEKHCADGLLMSVISDANIFKRHADLFVNVHLAGVNYKNNILVSGTNHDLKQLQKALELLGIKGYLLPVNHAFHSPLLEPIKDDYLALLTELNYQQPKVPWYSCQSLSLVAVEHDYDSLHLWHVIREPVHFEKLIRNIDSSNFNFIDLSASSNLSNFIKYGIDSNVSHFAILNQFCKNTDKLHKVLGKLKN